MTEEQIQYMIDNYPNKTKQEIANELGLTKSSVDWELRKRGLSKFKHVEWSEEDIKVLRAVYTVQGSKPCAAILGRRYKAVQKKAQELGIARLYEYQYIDADGYLVTRTDRNTSALRVHRLIMEEYLGRKLTEQEVIHHVDLNKLNNDISNLRVMTREEHARLHMELRAQDTRDSLD